MNQRILLLIYSFAAVAIIGNSGHSATPVITDLTHDGTLSWTCTTGSVAESVVEYKIEATTNLSSLQWTNLLSIFAPTGTTISTQVPMEDSLSFFRITAVVIWSGTNVPGPGMAFIPMGSFIMGNTIAGEGNEDEIPAHPLSLSGYYMDIAEISWAHWLEVYNWATNTGGYKFANIGDGKATNHPVQSVSWFDSVKWCNARSEKEGRTPAYYTSSTKTEVYRANDLPLTEDCVDWTCNGYRLPTEAEWEKAARGGLAGNRFPWGTTISNSLANYSSDTNAYAYDIGPITGPHPIFGVGDIPPYTSPTGSFTTNGYGLFDMAGNVWEWCWDWNEVGYYTNCPSADPHGPVSGTVRMARGGSFEDNADSCRTSKRGSPDPGSTSWNTGFRSVISSGN